jgi:hypothetical protein
MQHACGHDYVAMQQCATGVGALSLGLVCAGSINNTSPGHGGHCREDGHCAALLAPELHHRLETTGLDPEESSEWRNATEGMNRKGRQGIMETFAPTRDLSLRVNVVARRRKYIISLL